jgi:hypothetical protein
MDDSNVKFDEATQACPFISFKFAVPVSKSVASQKELAAFLDREQAQARVQSTIHMLTSMCWDK